MSAGLTHHILLQVPTKFCQERRGGGREGEREREKEEEREGGRDEEWKNGRVGGRRMIGERIEFNTQNKHYSMN